MKRESHKSRNFEGGEIYAHLSMVEFGNDPLCGDLCDPEFNGLTGRHEFSSVEFRNLPDLYDPRVRWYRNAHHSIPVDPQGDSCFLPGKGFKERDRIFAWGDEKSRGGE